MHDEAVWEFGHRTGALESMKQCRLLYDPKISPLENWARKKKSCFKSLYI